MTPLKARQDRVAECFSLAAYASSISDVGHPAVFGECNCNGPAIFGVARLTGSAVDGLWEQHDGGDELLVVVAGHFALRMKSPDGVEVTQDVGPGDAVFIPKGVAHAFHVQSPELQIFFVTPKDGNHGWNEYGGHVERH